MKTKAILSLLLIFISYAGRAQFPEDGNKLLVALGRSTEDSLVAAMTALTETDPIAAGMKLETEGGKLLAFTLFNVKSKEHNRYEGVWPFGLDSNTNQEIVSFAFGAPEKTDKKEEVYEYELPGVVMQFHFKRNQLTEARFAWSAAYREAGKPVQLREIQDYINRKFRKRIYANGNCTEGDCKDGHGSMVWRNQLKYEGDFKHKFAHGRGRIDYPKGGYYEGAFKWGYPHGQGVEVNASGQKWEGHFSYGERDGEGTLTLPDGTTMKGKYSNKKMNGEWQITYPSGQQVTVTYIDGKPIKN